MKKDKSFVSVVLATYNRKDMLKECLDSLFNQTYPWDRYEIVVVNDGSTDETEEVLSEYKKNAPCGFKWFSQENSGQTIAFNVGIDNSKGSIVCFTGDDCTADKSCIEKLSIVYEREDVGGVGGRILTSESSNFIANYVEKANFFSQEKSIKAFMIGGNSSFRRDVLKELKGFDTFFRNGQDAEISIRAQFMGFSLGFNPESIIYHKHKVTVKGVLEQLHRYEKSYARLHKKYTKNFNPGRRIVRLGYRLIRKIIITPFKFFKAFFVENSRFYVIEHFIDIIALSVMILGIIQETCFGKNYTGEKIDKKLEFIEKANLPGGWGL